MICGDTSEESMKQIPPAFEDMVVIYSSEEDGGWVAHSLRTDQIGIGGGIADALAEVMRAVTSVCILAAKDRTIQYLREAPENIQQLADASDALPREIYEVAYRKVTGTWPKGWDVTQPTGGTRAFNAKILEPVC